MTKDYINEAIKLATEKGGYKPYTWMTEKSVLVREERTGYHLWLFKDGGLNAPAIFSEILIDPLFWQALGRALGWTEIDVYNSDASHDGDWDRLMQNEWQYHAHRWLDSHFEGQQSEQDFWESLIKQKCIITI